MRATRQVESLAKALEKHKAQVVAEKLALHGRGTRRVGAHYGNTFVDGVVVKVEIPDVDAARPLKEAADDRSEKARDAGRVTTRDGCYLLHTNLEGTQARRALANLHRAVADRGSCHINKHNLGHT